VDQLKHITNQKRSKNRNHGEKRLSSTVDGGAKPNARPQCHQSKAPKHNVGTNGGAWDEEEGSGARRSTVT